MENRNEQELIRIQKLEQLKEQGIDPYGKRFEPNHNSKTLQEKYGHLDEESLKEKNITLCKNSYESFALFCTQIAW